MEDTCKELELTDNIEHARVTSPSACTPYDRQRGYKLHDTDE